MTLKILNNTYSLKEIYRMRMLLFKIFMSPRKIFNWLLVMFSQKFRLINTLGTPVHCYIETASYCNLRCPMCLKVQKGYEFENRNMMMDQFKLIMDQIGKNAITLRLWNFGEPFINSETIDMVNYASRFHVITVISTNGLLISPSLADKIVNSKLDFLIVSFDGGTKESYEYNRRNGNFEKFITCMENLANSRGKNPSKGPFTALQFVTMNTNRGEWETIRSMAEGWHFDKIMLRQLNVVTEKGEKLSYVEQDKLQVDKTNFCSNFWQEIVFNSTGDVVPCCMDAGPEVIMGNIYEKKLHDIWNGEIYKKARQKVLKNLESIPICKYTCYKRNNKLVFD